MDRAALILIIVLFVIQLLVIFMLVNLNMRYRRLKSSYASFMKGKDGKTLEKSMKSHFETLDALRGVVEQNHRDIQELRRSVDAKYEKTGIVRYDAFQEMGGNLSFALTLLDGHNNGWILNVMHSREGCYTYLKEVVNGESYMELSEEEAKSLDQAVYQEAYGLDIEGLE